MDLISREDAIRWVKTECNPYGKPTLDFESGKKVIEHLEQMPSAEHVRHGKWVPKTIIIGGRDHVSGMKCSVCGEDPLNAEGDEFLTDYCPNCGAKMDEEKENTYD